MFVLIRQCLIVLLFVFSMGAMANSFENNNQTIEFVDNTKGRVVIGDMEYMLRLNTKVTDSRKRQLNRYALRVGQKVKFSSSFKNKKHYLDSVVIVSR